jgi:hypothetical protein
MNGVDLMKKFISGTIFGLILALSMTAFANSEIIAKFTTFNFVVNGERVELESQPVVVNGSSYLPIREIATLLGHRVEYKFDTKTIELTSSTSNTELSGTGETDESSYDNTSPVPDSNWISLMDLQNYGILEQVMGIMNENNVKLQEGQQTSIKVNDGYLVIKQYNYRTYFDLESLKKTGLIE